MWVCFHADRSPWATSGHAGRLLKDVVPRSLWQELMGPSGHKLRLLEAGGHIHGYRSPGLLEPSATLQEDLGPHGQNRTLTSSGPPV